jgi:TonB-dependent receptor
LNLRFARTENIGRPDFGNIMPNEQWLTNYHLVRRSNPELRPQTSEKYDFAIEYYFKRNGVVSLAFFRQNLKDVIVTQTSYFTVTHDPLEAGPDVIYEPDYEEGQWSVNTPVNTGKGRNQGVELSYRQRLGFIAGWLDNFQIFSSYSYADPKTWYMRRTVSAPRAPALEADLLAWQNSPRVQEEIPMPGIQKRSASLQLHYLGKKFSGKIAGYWVGRFARDINRDIVEINYQDAYIRYDLSLNYKLSSRWTATFDWRNVTNEGDSRHIFDRTGGYFTSGMVINVGVKADF